MPYLILICSLLFSFSVYSETHPHGAVLFHYKGEVLVKSSSSDFEKAEKGDILVEGDFIKTGPRGLAIVRFADNSTLRITPNSNIIIETLVEPVEGNILGSTNLILKAGQLFIDVINKNEAPVFHIKTNSVAMGVRGTRFFAGIDEKTGHTELAVKKGVVEIINPAKKDHSEAIEAGHGIHVEKGSFSQPQKYDWVKELDFNTNKETFDHKKNRNLHERKRAEFVKKRKNWVRDDNKWKLHKQRWTKFKVKHEERAAKLKKAREAFKLKRKEFKSKKKELIEKRKSLKIESKNLIKEAARLRKSEKQLNREVSRLKSGRKDPRLKMKIAKKKAALTRDKKALKEKREELKKKKASLTSEKKVLARRFKSSKKKFKKLKAKGKRHSNRSRRLKKRRKMLKKKMLKDRPQPGSSNTGGHGDGHGGNSGGSSGGGHSN